MIILNEKEYAEKCIENKDIGEKPVITLSILAKYYRQYLGYKKKRIVENLIGFISKYYQKYEQDTVFWKDTIEKLATNASKKPLIEISGVSISKEEMNRIKEIHNKTLERLAFVILCLAKLGNKRNPNNNGWVTASSKEIFDYARISCKSIDREKKIGTLWSMGLLEFPKKSDNLNIRVTFIDDSCNEEELFISDFRELGYEYMMYCGGNFIRCAECGIIVRGSKNQKRKYCDNCKRDTNKDTKIVECIDCGASYTTSSKANKTCRCPSCYKIYRKDYFKNNKRKQREN